MKKIEKEISSYCDYEVNADIVKNKIDFDKYKKPKKRNNLFAIKLSSSFAALIVVIAAIAGIVSVLNNKKPSNLVYSLENRRTLSKLVYNYSVIDDESQIIYDLDNIDELYKDNNFNYSEIRIENSYAFKVVSQLSFYPYFNTDLTNKEINVIISDIDLNASKIDEEPVWYSTEMIVISYQDEINGFLSPSLIRKDYLAPRNKIYEFDSSFFLTNEQVVKYYEKGDTLYSFKVDMQSEDIIFSVDAHYNYLQDNATYKYVETSAVRNTYIELEKDYTLNLINYTKISKIKTSAVITGIDGNIIYVKSEKNPSLNSLNPTNYCSIKLNGIEINENENPDFNLEIGMTIEFYYYQRNANYLPKDIVVDSINIIK